MDSNFWYRGTKAVDFCRIPGIAGGIGGALKRYHLMVQPFFFCASNHSIEPGWGTVSWRPHGRKPADRTLLPAA